MRGERAVIYPLICLVGIVVLIAVGVSQFVVPLFSETVNHSASPNPGTTYDAFVELPKDMYVWQIVASDESLPDVDVMAADARSLYMMPKQSEWDTTFWKKHQDPSQSQCERDMARTLAD